MTDGNQGATDSGARTPAPAAVPQRRPWLLITQSAVGAIAGAVVTVAAFTGVGMSIDDLKDRVEVVETSAKSAAGLVDTQIHAVGRLQEEVRQSDVEFKRAAKAAIDADLENRGEPVIFEVLVGETKTTVSRYCALSRVETYTPQMYGNSICEISFDQKGRIWTLKSDRRNRAGSECRMVCIGV